MRIITIRKDRLLTFLFTGILFLGVMKAYGDKSVEVFSMPIAQKVIVIDAGHGGWDPGKVSKKQDLEKDINLVIAQKLQKYFEQAGAYVLVTRVDDSALGEKKRTDLKNRKNIVNEGKADIFISIHQNAYPQSEIKGAQVFYYNDSDKSKALAEKIQDEFKKTVDASNKRSAKANTDYYLLKETKIPAVIVECGFLSNSGEADHLIQEDHQEKIAWAIYSGVIEFFKDK